MLFLLFIFYAENTEYSIMYRETLLGSALSAVLEEAGASLSESHKQHLWKLFDETMEECLSEAPVMTQIHVSTPAKRPIVVPAEQPQLVTESSAVARQPEGSSVTSSDVLTDDGTEFPVYRLVDDLWTVLLKDPEVTVRDELGHERKLHLDYLKVQLREENAKAAAGVPGKAVRKRGRA